MKQVVVHPGFLEQERHFKRFKAALLKNGYELTIDQCYKKLPLPGKAVHVSHSAGILCANFQTVKLPKLIVAPPMSNHEIKRRLTFKLFSDLHWAATNKELGFWVYKTFWSIVALFEPKIWLKIAKEMKSHKFELDRMLAQEKVRIIANTSDPLIGRLCDDKRCVPLPGHHDDILYRPYEYISQIRMLQ